MFNNKKIIESNYTDQKKDFNSKYIWWHYTFEKLAIYIAAFLIKFDISANLISVISLIFGLFGCAFIAVSSEKYFILGIMLIFVWQILDDVDGHIARTKKSTDLGKYLDDSGANLMYAFFYASMGISFISYTDNGYGLINITQDETLTRFTVIISGLLSSIFISLNTIFSFHYRLLSSQSENLSKIEIADPIKSHNIQFLLRFYRGLSSNILEFPGFLVPLVLIAHAVGYLSILLIVLAFFNLMAVSIKYFSVARKLI